MTKITSFTELLFKGMLASYLLFYAFQIHKHPQKFTALFSENVSSYANSIGLSVDVSNRIENYMLYYCQFLVLASLAIVCGMRAGKILGWIAVIVNLALSWSKIQMLYIGIHFIFVGIVL